MASCWWLKFTIPGSASSSLLISPKHTWHTWHTHKHTLTHKTRNKFYFNTTKNLNTHTKTVWFHHPPIFFKIVSQVTVILIVIVIVRRTWFTSTNWGTNQPRKGKVSWYEKALCCVVFLKQTPCKYLIFIYHLYPYESCVESKKPKPKSRGSYIFQKGDIFKN